MIAIDLRKQRPFDDDPKAIQQVNFTGNLAREARATILFIIEEAKKNCFRFFRRNSKSILILFLL